MENTYFLGINESPGQLFVKNGSLYCQGITESASFEISGGIDCLFSAYPAENGKIIAFCSQNKNSISAAIIEKGKIASIKPILNQPHEKTPLCAYLDKKIYVIMPHDTQVDIYTISSESPQKETIFKGEIIKDLKLCCLFSPFAAALTPKGIELYSLLDGRKASINEKNLHHFSLCAYENDSYIMAVSQKTAFLFIWKNNTVEKYTVFTGSSIKNCCVFIKNAMVYLCAYSEGKIYYRCCGPRCQNFSSMGTLPLYEKCVIEKGFFKELSLCCQEFYTSSGKPLPELYPLLYSKKIIVENQVNKESKTLIETLSKDISAMSSQNSILNLKYKAVQDKYISQISALKDENQSLKEQNKQLLAEKEHIKNEAESLRKSISHITEENTLLKKAKKLLEEEIYTLNSPQVEEKDN